MNMKEMQRRGKYYKYYFIPKYYIHLFVLHGTNTYILLFYIVTMSNKLQFFSKSTIDF